MSEFGSGRGFLDDVLDETPETGTVVEVNGGTEDARGVAVNDTAAGAEPLQSPPPGLHRPGRQNRQQVRRLTEADADVVFVMDISGSMDCLINRVREFALNFPQRLESALQTHQRMPRRLRVRVIGFRDFYYDIPPHPPIEASDFFTVRGSDGGSAEDAAEMRRFHDFVSSLEPFGGEDDSESALEALHLAFRSDWSRDPAVSKRRHIVVLFTDDDAHPLNDPRRDNPGQNPGSGYPADAPRSMPELYEEYLQIGGSDSKARRLIIFTPDKGCWKDLAWDGLTHQLPVYTTQQVDGADELMYDFDDTVLFDLLGGSL